MSHTFAGKDDLIGKTTIDLEDRWFDNRWQIEGRENRRLPGEDLKNPGNKSIVDVVWHKSAILFRESALGHEADRATNFISTFVDYVPGCS